MSMVPESKYESPLTARYCKDSPLRDILSERNKTILWRQLWIWLAEAKMELGLKQINEAQIIEMRANRDQIDFAVIRAEERRLKHDVMAHNRAFGKVCPSAAGIVHLGATSCYVQDNADLIVQREACDHLLRRLAICLHRLDEFAQLHGDTVTVGRTHFQTASLVTIGKRAVLWAQELLEAFNQLQKFRLEMRFRGVKGATGTQDSFLTLFDGDEGMVEHLDELVTKKAGFGNNRFIITGQTYPRMQDVQLLNALAALGAATQKICGDIRMLQAFGELLEPFEPDQVGSSAMPYKRNPMKAERCCGLARLLIDAPQKALLTQANQGFERTLDDSSARRIYIPDSLLTAEAILMTLQTIFEGMTVQEKAVKRLVETELPFLALEKALMWLTEGGHDRQMAHEKIRAVALSAREVQKERTITVADILSDGIFDPIRDRLIALANEPLKFTGRCQSQTILYLKQELRPAIAQYLTEKFETKMVLDV